MPNVFVSKENFVEDDDWLTGRAITDNTNEIFGVGTTPPANLAALKADAVYGDAARAGEPAFTTDQYVLLGDASHAYWNGTAWVVGDAP